MILVYTHKITPRVRYTFKHIFTRILSVEVDFTSKVEKFVAHNGPKMSYTTIPLGKEFFVKSTNLLFEQGISDIDIEVSNWDGIPCFFYQGVKSTIPFDIFSASFFLITRYEEYLPHIKDVHERFPANQSLAFQNGFLEKPVVDIWAYKLLDSLKEKFPDLEHGSQDYRFISTIDVDNAYAYKHKSVIRAFGGLFKDIYNLHFMKVFDRIAVRFNLKKDPFDTFENIVKLKNKYDIKTIFFFLISDYTSFDTNVSAFKTKFRLLIKDMVDYARVGLHPSYYTMQDVEKLKSEKERLEGITNMPIFRSRQHYLRFSLPETLQKLIDLEIHEDHSMGYASHVGFRASTCTPFYFYDLDFEIQTPLKIFPFALMDTTLNDYMKLTPKQSLGKINDLYNEVKKVNGTFITLFHNESLSGYSRWKGWERVYESMLKIVTK
ncbi:polysaccharide deacetylase family protein [Tenacibaculum agarivorans]|uniref:polysaccharide deacetylase family protein n=1 Tax=Tenacibaculum agarivorans TaxID=1908389 RepID=UPI00094BB47D|nr:polysaccharide deacetylase family protein [Tenacibaculum agarivorans]